MLIASNKGEGDAPLASIRRELMTVRDSIPLSELFDHFLQKRQHISIVLDEYGGTKGLVTLEDLVETLIGIEIIDETDSVVDMRALARQQWLERAKSMGLKAKDD
jgi:CBS domain containing-hemolysin-like protein